MDLNIVAYATLALSLFVSAVKMGGWILNADPRAIVSAGRWALAGLPILSVGALSWLVASGRWTAAMLMAAFLLPVIVQAAPRWRLLLDPFFGTSRGVHPFASDLGGSVVPSGYSATRPPSDPHLVAQSIAVLRDYVEQSNPQIPPPARAQITHYPSDSHCAEVAAAQPVDGSARLSTAEAFEVLGLKPTPSPREVKEAHRRLAQLLHSELDDTHYLVAKIDEARDVLLGD